MTDEVTFKEHLEKVLASLKDGLPKTYEMETPEMKYHVLADGVFWEDEGIEKMDIRLSNVFRFVLNYRTHLITRQSKVNLRSKIAYDLAREHFPNWIGFQEDRCSFDKDLAIKIARIREVSRWKLEKLILDEEE